MHTPLAGSDGPKKDESAESLEAREVAMKEELVKMREKMESDGKKIQNFLDGVTSHTEEVSFMTERHHEMEVS